MGEGKGGGGKDDVYFSASLYPPPVYPLLHPPSRLLRDYGGRAPGEGKLVVGQTLCLPLSKGDLKATTYSRIASTFLQQHEACVKWGRLKGVW